MCDFTFIILVILEKAIMTVLIYFLFLRKSCVSPSVITSENNASSCTCPVYSIILLVLYKQNICQQYEFITLQYLLSSFTWEILPIINQDLLLCISVNEALMREDYPVLDFVSRKDLTKFINRI